MNRTPRTGFAAVVFASALAGSLAAQENKPLVEIGAGESLAIVGNTLAERMQHDGWLEARLQQRLRGKNLAVRNLGFSGDEVVTRLRSFGFGAPDERLTQVSAGTVFAFFGFNESFQGAAGLPQFKKDLDAYLAHVVRQKYNGKSNAKLVLFSPIAYQNLKDPNLPNADKLNAQIEPYAKAMAEVAQSHQTPFVDLFAPTKELFAKSDEPLTINGVHLNERGNELVAEIVERALFGSAADKVDPKLRAAVQDKNFIWFNRYRAVDGYSSYGVRADLKFVDGQTNREVMNREFEILDEMTANRDRRIWAAAEGKELVVDDSNTKPFIPVKTNKPGPGPNGAHLFLTGEEAIGKMTVAKGMKINLFASEEKFPDLAKPVQMAFDTRGRLWVAVMPSYPHWKPKDKMADKLLILEDTDGDGSADKCTVFADGLHVPTGLEFWNGGVFVGGQPDLIYLKDTDGDDKADVRKRVIHGVDSADTHHALNSFTLGPGGGLFFQEGTFHRTQVETPYGLQRCADAGVFRYDPVSQRFDVYVSYAFANPHGHVFDRWGQDFVTDGTSNQNYFAAAFSSRIDYPNKHPSMRTYFQQRVRPCGGTEILSSKHFPAEMQGNLLNANVIGFQGILQYKYNDEGSGFTAEEVEPIVYSSDANFRPVDIEMGPDGAIYFVDWQNPIIGHMQHNLRDPSRDQTHGRVYRVTYEGRALTKPAKIAGESIANLLELLKDADDRVRARTKIELSARNAGEVVAAAAKWAAGLDRNDANYWHHALEALWVHELHHLPNAELLETLLKSPDFRARAAATRVLCAWRDKLPNALELLKRQAADAHPRVRLEAVRAASWLDVPEAVEIPAIAADYPTDYYIEYCKTETLRRLEPIVKRALAANQPIAMTTDAGARYLLSAIDIPGLLKMDRTRAVCLELLGRTGVRDEERTVGAEALAKFDHTSAAAAILDTIRRFDKSAVQRDPSVMFDLVRLLGKRGPAELAAVRKDLDNLALSGAGDMVRRLGFVALVNADGNADAAWKLAQTSPTALRDFTEAAVSFGDPSVRASLYPKFVELLGGFPASMNVAKAAASGSVGRYVRIELPGQQRTLTLAEVEVMSGGKNMALGGKAKQKNTSHNGNARRAVDGKKSGAYGQGGQTHTQENTADPWWEVDLGDEYPIETIAVYNRTEADHGKRLDGFTLKVLDAKRAETFALDEIPAPETMAEFDISAASPEAGLRRAAMAALVSVRGKEAETFKLLAKYFKDGIDKQSAAQALQRLPVAEWPAEELPALLDATMKHLRDMPTTDRSSPAGAEIMQVGYALASRLPAERGKAVRKELGALGVRTIRLATVPDQMIYDQERLVVEAGKPVEIQFDNPDLMPHNIVFLQPGALVEVGEIAESTGLRFDALARQYVPESAKIWYASRLLQPRQKQRLRFAAPQKAGVYPYVCTYPGHWRRMYGALFVVPSLDDYLAAPESYLAANAIAAVDEMLKNNRPRKEWKLDELAGEVAKLEGRNFASGKQMFTVANCIACHRLGGVGNQFGPELTKLDPKYTNKDVLHSILEPSHKIEDKYATYLFPMDDGRTVTGMIVEENPDVIKVVENPLASAKPTELKRGDVLGRKKSTTSLMPKGMLDKLTKQEILDLLAYVIAAGDAKHKVYAGGHDAQHGHGK